MDVLNAPGKVTASPRLVRADARRQKALRPLSAIFKTEMADDARAAALVDPGDGWTLTRQSGKGDKRGIGECAILTRDAARRVVATDWPQLTDGGGKGRLVRPAYAVVAITEAPSGRRTLFTGAHLPAHIEGKWARLPMPERVRVRRLFREGRRGSKVDPGILEWITAVRRWRAAVMDLAAKYDVDDIVVAPDGNVDAHKPWVREMIRRAWPGLNLCVTEADDLGKRAVGWVLTTMDQDGTGTVYRQESSDHKAGRLTLRHLNPDRHQPKPKTPPPPFSMCTYSGVRMTHYLKTALQGLERGPLKDLAPLTVYQGDRHKGVAASAGTHDGAGVVDLAPAYHGRKIKAWRETYGPGWHRLPSQGPWAEHNHCVIESCSDLAPLARAQVGQYHQGLDGLADHRRDPNQFHPRVFWDYEKAWHALNEA